MCRSDMEEEYGEMKKMMGNVSIHMFRKGFHQEKCASSDDAVIQLTILKGGSYLTGLLYTQKRWWSDDTYTVMLQAVLIQQSS